ncbi:hypothetical protein YSY43_07950 [Paenibacillus sp. YSY-4.3]
MYQEFEFSFLEGESSVIAQQRAIKTFMELLKTYEGKNMVIGTHEKILYSFTLFFDSCNNFCHLLT